MANVDVIVFKGVRYRRYPDAEKWSERAYYVPGISDRQKKGRRRLHEDIWIDAHGPIPEGHHVHHADHDPLNNDLSNLVCLPGAEHRAHHGELPRTEKQQDNWRKVQAKAAEWHGSDEGRTWHSEHAKQGWETRAYVERCCEQCEVRFLTRNIRGHERFCSNACKSAWRRTAGLDDVEATCVNCGATFRKNKYRKTRFCSRSCGATWQHAQRET